MGKSSPTFVVSGELVLGCGISVETVGVTADLPVDLDARGLRPGLETAFGPVGGVSLTEDPSTDAE